MKINILDIDKFIKNNVCNEVTNPINFNSDNTPTDDGLFSIKIFGQLGSKDRKNNWGYINLRKHFLSPVIYKLLKELNRNIEKCIMGQGYFIINGNGELVEDPNGENGITFIYNNFEKLKFKNTGSTKRENRLDLLSKLNKDQIFVNKWLVIPCALRDYKVPKKEGSRIEAVDEINELYRKLIRLCGTLSDDDGFAFSGTNTEANVQMCLNEIYKMLTSSLAKKTGIIHQGLIGKSVDYATRSVISAPRFNVNKWEETPVKFGYTGVPLSQIIVLFYPFFVKYVQDMVEPFRDELESKGVNVNEEFSEEKINKMVDLFYKAPDLRFKPLMVHTTDGREIPVKFYYEDLHRDFSLTDLVYLASEDIVRDKHVYVTRYPIEQYQNIYPSKITILSTQKTVEQVIHGEVFKNYPVIYPDYPGKLDDDEVWIDTVRPHNSYLNSLGLVKAEYKLL